MSEPTLHPQGCSPAAERNSAPIFERLSPLVDELQQQHPQVTLLEVASGTGQHAAYFAAHHPHLLIQPTDLHTEEAEGVASWAREANVSERVLPLRALDVCTPPTQWPQLTPHMIYCANMLHIAPWSAARGLFQGAAHLLKRGGYLVTYGPYRFEGEALSPSNLAFEARLKERDDSWGIREVSHLDALAEAGELTRVATHALPANNHLLVYCKA